MGRRIRGLALITAAALGAGTPTLAGQGPASAAATVLSNTFEQNGVQGWTAVSGETLTSATGVSLGSGSRSLQVTKSTPITRGPRRSIPTAKLTPGRWYSVSAGIRLAPGSAPATFRIRPVQTGQTGSYHTARAQNTTWARPIGSFRWAAGKPLAFVVEFVKTCADDRAPVTFYLDNVTVRQVAGRVPAPPTPPCAGNDLPTEPHQDNPYVGAQLFVDPSYRATATAEVADWPADLKTAGLTVATTGAFIWMDSVGALDPPAGLGLRDYLDLAVTQQRASRKRTAVQLVLTNLQECATTSPAPPVEDEFQRYTTQFIDPVVATLADPKYRSLRIITVIEPQILPHLITSVSLYPACAEAMGPGGYRDAVRYALNRLSAVPNVYRYLDVGRSSWLGWRDNYDRTVPLYSDLIESTDKGWAGVDGFISNVADYVPLEEPFLKDSAIDLRESTFYEWNPYMDERSFMTDLRADFLAAGAPSGIGMLIDTARNGWGGPDRPDGSTGTTPDQIANSGRIDRRIHRSNWCNQPGGVGLLPTAAPAPGFDAWVWVRAPGISDGSSRFTPNDEGKVFDRMCDPTYGGNYSNNNNPTGALPDAPIEGAWFPQAFTLLVRNAYPPLT